MFGRKLRTLVNLIFGPPPEPNVSDEAGFDYFYKLMERMRDVHEFAQQALTVIGYNKSGPTTPRAGVRIWPQGHWCGSTTQYRRMACLPS